MIRDIRTKTRYFSINFQVQGLIFTLIVYQFDVSLYPREAYTSYISTANLIIQDSHSKYSYKSRFYKNDSHFPYFFAINYDSTSMYLTSFILRPVHYSFSSL
jgi:hypothetical protein